jgi:hypothetical protein
MDFTGEAGDALLMVTVDDRERRTNNDVTSQDTDFFFRNDTEYLCILHLC